MVSDLLSKTLRYRWVIFALLAAGYILVFFHRICPAVLAVDLMRDLNSGGSLTGLLGAAYFYPYAIMQLPAGLLSDFWGPRKTISFFFVIAFIGSVIMGMAPTVAWAILGRSLVGVGVGMLFVPTLKILSQWFRPSEFAIMAALMLTMGGVGSITATTPLVWLSAWIGWRQAFLLVGGFTLVVAVLVWILVRNRPADLGWPAPFAESTQVTPTIGLVEGIKRVLSCRSYWFVGAWFFFDFAVFFTFGGLWGGPYLIHVYGMNRSQAGNMMFILAIGLVVGGPFLSWLSDKVFKGRKPVLVMCAVIVTAITALMAFLTADIPLWGLYLIYFFLPIFGNTSGAIGFTMNKELFPVAMAGTATGLVNLFPFVAGAVFQPLFGYILERYGKVGGAFTAEGYQAAFVVLFIAAILALVSAMLTRETLQGDIRTA
jgi:sugar phosphate permease